MANKKTPKATGTTSITAVSKGEVYRTKTGALVTVENGRLKDEGEHGRSFTGRWLEYDAKSRTMKPSKTTDRIYLDELVQKMSPADVEEWLAVERREAEAIAAAGASPETASTRDKTTKRKAGTRSSKEPSTATPKKLSALDAAAKVLAEAGEPMAAKALIEAMAAKGYWTSPGGLTPHATLYAAILREISVKGDEARFVKTGRGRFGLAGIPARAAQ